jgi:hypothetical protein
MKKKRNSEQLMQTMGNGKRVRRYDPACVAFVKKLPVIRCGKESVGRKRIPREWQRRGGQVIPPK